MRLFQAVLMSLLTASAAAVAQTPARPAAAPEKPALLTGESYWRKHYTFFPPALSVSAAKAVEAPADLPARRKYLERFYVTGIETPPPPAGWTGRDFDDAEWLLSRGRQFVVGDGRLMEYSPVGDTSAYLRGTDPFVEEIGLIAMRGEFLVRDPKAVGKLTLSLTYRGGFVACLNGKEVARANLPAGKITPETPADDYPLEAFFVKDSIAGKQYRGLHPFTDAKSDQWALRERTFGPLEIPGDALVAGVNVLSVELHRSDYPAEARPEKVNWDTPRTLGWSPVGLSLLRLEQAGDGAESMPPKSKGLQVWNTGVTEAVGRFECAPPDAAIRPIRIVAARNGQFSGQVLVRNEGGIAGIAATVSDLKHAGGKPALPASAAVVRYGAVNPVHGGGGVGYLDAVLPPEAPVNVSPRDGKNPLVGRFDLLVDTPPTGVESMPVWVTVRVPKDAAPGEYAGELTVAVTGAAPVKVPVSLSVADWTLPDIKDRAALTNIYESPDTLAAYYKVQPWSEAHWKLIERSLKLIGEAGNIGLFIPLLAEGQLGNPESMVVWIKGKDGAFTHDFARFDRYMDIAMKYHDPGRLRFVALDAWGYQCSPGKSGKAYGAEVTVREADPGAPGLGKMKLPEYGTAECEKLLRPLLTGLKDRLVKRGLGGKVWLGLPADGSPPPAGVAMFRNILPDSPWIRESHFDIGAFGYDVKDKAATVPVAYNSIVWGGEIPDPAAKRLYGWRYNPKHLVMTFNRPGTECLVLTGFPSPWSFRMWMESTLACGRNGNGRVGADYFYMGMTPRGGSGRISSEAGGGCSGTLFGSYLPSGVGQVGLGNTTTDLLGPGPDGPVTTVRFENAREGDAEAEARIAIEKALLDKEKPLPAELAAKAQKLLDERTNVLRMWAIGAAGAAPCRWQERTRALYDLAGEVAKRQ